MDKKLFHQVDAHNIRINHSSPTQALHEVESLIATGKNGYVCFVEANTFSQAMKNPEIRDVINSSSMTYPDGISVAKIASLCSGEKIGRVSGPSFFLNCCEYGVDRQWRHFFFGGGDGVAQKLAETMQKKYPGIQISGYYTPPFRPLTTEEELQVKNMIESNNTDLLWVGLGGPKQELWMHSHLSGINVPVMFGVGAAFDFHTQTRPWAPKIIRTIGMEWLWRMISGGKQTCKRNLVCVSRIAIVFIRDFLHYKIISFLFHAKK